MERTQKMMSDFPADWDEIKKAVEVKNQLNPNLPFHGNGDVLSLEDGMEKAKYSGVDGLMIGRGIFSNPWLYNSFNINPDPSERLETLLDHANLFTDTWKDTKNFQYFEAIL